MPKILALDTSTDACSVALHCDGQAWEDFRVIPRQHTQALLPMVQQILAEHGLGVTDLDAIAVGRGPGSFAGIRIAMGAAQGLAFAAQLPLLPVSTLAAMALTAHQRFGCDYVVSALDARMNEIYAAAYRIRDGRPQALMAETVCAPELLTLPQAQAWLAAGSGWRYLDAMSGAVRQAVTVAPEDIYPSALAMLQLALDDWKAGKAVAAEEALPVYLRDEVAWKKKDQQ